MRIIKSVSEMQSLSLSLKRSGKTIGFVPTMGFLHEGHLSLMKIAREKSDILVVSIFVNPLQFGPNEDFSRYPRNFESDEKFCREEKVDIIFYPDINEIYTDHFQTEVKVKGISDKLCGVSRPTHFAGVTTIVAKLFNIVLPDIAVFGQKDAQQAVIIRRMTQDLNFPIEIIVAPTIREPDGLAMSSRNSYLTPEERRKAPILYRALLHAKSIIEKNSAWSPAEITDEMREMIESVGGFSIDYIEIVDADSLERIKYPRSGKILVALAACIGKTRLIDNIVIDR